MKAQTLKVKVVFTIIHFGESGKILETKNTNEDNNDEKEIYQALIIVTYFLYVSWFESFLCWGPTSQCHFQLLPGN